MTVGEGAADPGGLLYLVDGPAEVALAAGDTASLTVTVGTGAGADLALEAHLISPWGTWEWIGPAALGAVLPAARHRRARLRREPTGVAGARRVVGPGPGRLRRPAGLFAGGAGDRHMSSRPGGNRRRSPRPGRRARRGRGAAARRPGAAALPRRGTSEGRQLRRWLTQLIVTERVIAAEAAARGLTARGAPGEEELLPDATARLEIGSIAAAALADPSRPGAVRRRHRPPSRSPTTRWPTTTPATRCGSPRRAPARTAGCRRRPSVPPLGEVRPAIVEHLRAAARRRAFRVWLDARCAELVELAPGYEHPGDPRQPDNTHRH